MDLQWPTNLLHLTLGQGPLTTTCLVSATLRIHYVPVPLNVSLPRLTHLSIACASIVLTHGLPLCLTHLTLCKGFHRIFRINALIDSSVTHLENLGESVLIETGSTLPHTLTHLFGFYWKGSITSLSLTHLSGVNRCSVSKPIQFPPALTYLSYGNLFNQPVHALPSSLTHLTFGDSFNSHISSVPAFLTHLTFGKIFNYPVGVISPHTHPASFDDKYSKQFILLPHSLTHLVFGMNFNQPIAALPVSLVHVCFGFAFTHSVQSWPSYLQYVIFVGKEWSDPSITSLPREIYHKTRLFHA